MDAERTELTWTFTPADLFDLTYEAERYGARLSITGGEALVTVRGSQPSPAVEDELKAWVLNVLRVRALQTGKVFELKTNAIATELKDGQGAHLCEIGVGSGVLVGGQRGRGAKRCERRGCAGYESGEDRKSSI